MTIFSEFFFSRRVFSFNFAVNFTRLLASITKNSIHLLHTTRSFWVRKKFHHLTRNKSHCYTSFHRINTEHISARIAPILNVFFCFYVREKGGNSTDNVISWTKDITSAGKIAQKMKKRSRGLLFRYFFALGLENEVIALCMPLWDFSWYCAPFIWRCFDLFVARVLCDFHRCCRTNADVQWW